MNTVIIINITNASNHSIMFTPTFIINAIINMLILHILRASSEAPYGQSRLMLNSVKDKGGPSKGGFLN